MTMTKTIDALKMSRRLREQTSRQLATLTREQRMALLDAHIRPGSAVKSAKGGRRKA